MAEGDQRLLTPEDDGFHPVPDGEWWFTETCWFSFFIPERNLGCWLYGYVRPNIGISGGGCWIWDDRTFLHWEAPYYANHSALRLPEPRDLRAFTFPSGLSVEVLEPLARYRLGYTDRDVVAIDLEFAAVMEPWVRVHEGEPSHFDQLGRVTGTVVLHGESLAVDCLAVRDRTWAVRSERFTKGGGFGYTTASATPDHALFAVADGDSAAGYLVRDGHRCGLRSGRRTVERDPDHGYITRVVLEAVDDDGRSTVATGVPVSRMAMPIPGVSGVAWTSLVRWQLDGADAWGEDQEPWPTMAWSMGRRSGAI